MTLNPQALVNIAVKAAEDKKADEITVLDISKISVIADYFIICSGRSSIHVQSIADNIMEAMDEQVSLSPRREGMHEGRWVLLDYGDVVVHIFQDEERQFYNLERLWGDATVVGVSATI